MRVDLITIFPRMLDSIVESSILRRAIDNNLLQFYSHDLRKWSDNKHFTVDDRPFGGGAGMLLQPIPIANAIRAIKEIRSGYVNDPFNSTRNWESLQDRFQADTEDCNTEPVNLNNKFTTVNTGSNHDQVLNSRKGDSSKQFLQCVVYLCPDGELLNTNIVKELSNYDQLILISGHYEGIDQRVRDKYIDREISIGDYVLTNGTIAAGVLLDAVCRYIPGVLGNSVSLEQDSFSDGLLTFPQYSRPEIFEGIGIPEVLLSGNHKEINNWRMQQRKERTKRLRPDLYEKWLENHNEQ